MVLVVDLPLDEERALRVDGQVVDPDLLPAKVEPVGPATMTVDCAATQPGLDGGDVADAHGPAEPPAAFLGARLDRSSERCGVDGRMIEHADHLDVAAIEQRQHEVAGAEGRVHTTIGERGPEARAEPLNTGRQSLGPRRVGEVVESHPPIVDDCGPCSVPGSLTAQQREVLLQVGVGDMAGSSGVHTQLSAVSALPIRR